MATIITYELCLKRDVTYFDVYSDKNRILKRKGTKIGTYSEEEYNKYLKDTAACIQKIGICSGVSAFIRFSDCNVFRVTSTIEKVKVL
jgi:hypothetical protein